MKVAQKPSPSPQVLAHLVYVPTSANAYIVKESETGRYFRLNAATVHIMHSMDGTHSLEEIGQLLQYSPAIIDYVYAQLTQLRLINQQHTPVRQNTSYLLYRLLFLRKSVITSDRWMEKVYAFLRLRYLFRPWLLFALAILYVIAGGLSLYYHTMLSDALRALSIPQNIHLSTILLIFGVFCVTCVLHELAHGFACKHFGGSVQALGVGLYFFCPVLYSDVSDAWLFRKRSQRLITHAAGLLMNFFLTALALCFLPLAPAGSWLLNLIAIIFLVSFLLVLTNLNPLIKLDGYYILADALGIENMRDKAFSTLFAFLNFLASRSGLTRIPPLVRTVHRSKREQIFLVVYAVLSLTYILFFSWSISLLYASLTRRYIGDWSGAFFCLFFFFMLILPLQQSWIWNEKRKKLARKFLNTP